MLLIYLTLFRVHQYIKNFFVFAPLFFSFQLKIDSLINALIAFGLFSLMASTVYIFNDLMDIEEDKKHPEKKNRALASGDINVFTAKLLFVISLLFSLIISFFFNKNLFFILGFYFLLNILYSAKLKHVAIIDVFIIAIGFVLRVVAGGIATNIPLSEWIIIVTFLLALFLGISKRKHDIVLALEGKKTRKNIEEYNIEFVNATMSLMAAVIIISYILYTISSEVVARLETENLYFTSFFVILGIIRYMQISFLKQEGGDPTKIVLKDKFMQITILFWIVSFFAIVKCF